MTPKIWVVNLPFSNFYSLARYFHVRSLDYDTLTCSDHPSFEDIIFLPGVGTFAQGMNYLIESNIKDILLAHALHGGKIIGICLGMQMLFSSSYESPESLGLNIISGHCKKIQPSNDFLVPHIGWNTLVVPDQFSKLFPQITTGQIASCPDFYFVHSYYAIPSDPLVISASFIHPSGLLCAAVAYKNIFGFQFHPEKSGPSGYLLLDRAIAS